MRVENLPSPGVIVGAIQVRREAAKIISKAELQHNAVQAAALRDFFIACANAAVAAAGGTSTVVAVPATSAVVANGASVVVNDNAGTANAKSPGVATVVSGVLTKVTLAA